MPPQIERQGINIVLLGQFNPAIFHPSWFAAQKLVRVQEAEVANIELVHPQVAIFTMEWLRLQITVDRFQASTTQEAYYEPLRDLVVGVFSLLNYSTLTAMGVNRDFHCRLESEKAWHAVGHELVPKPNWNEVLDTPGMLSLTVQGKRPDALRGYIRVKVEPSTQVQYGVYVEVNDHYELGSVPDNPTSTNQAVAILSERWAESLKRGLKIAEKVASLGVLK